MLLHQLQRGALVQDSVRALAFGPPSSRAGHPRWLPGSGGFDLSPPSPPVFCCFCANGHSGPEHSGTWSRGAPQRGQQTRRGPDPGLRPLVCLFAAVWFTGQSTSSLSGVRGRRSVAVVELPAFPGTIRAFPCLHVYMAALTNVKY